MIEPRDILFLFAVFTLTLWTGLMLGFAVFL